MFCRICNVLMNSGTEYKKKKDDNDKGYKRYNKCPKCHTKIYNNSQNFQDVMREAMKK